MADVLVVNASPLIALAAIGCEHLLTMTSRTVLIPTAARTEILAGPSDDRARTLLERGWAQTVEPNQMPANVVEWGLGSGESSVLAVALETPNSTAVLDDAAARIAARILSIPVMATVGLIIQAKQRHHISSAAHVIEQLKMAGLYLDDELVKSLQRIGENWPPVPPQAS